MSIWEFNKQPEWIASGGLDTTYSECLFQPDDISEQKRIEVMPTIKASIDNNLAVISWDIGVLEWGLITGYDDERQKFATLSIFGAEDEMDYSLLGRREMPMLNVVTITGINNKKQEDIIADTLKLAKAHLNGEEWCDNIKGLAAYPALIQFFEMDDKQYAACWNMEYYLGTYTALKWYAYKFFEKYDLSELRDLYKTVYEAWQKAYELKKTTDLTDANNCKVIAQLLRTAQECEKKALILMN
jgi:hypothetical protein